MTVANNDFARASYMPVRIKGIMPHGANYWRDNGVTEPARDDYVYHVEFNHIHDYGEGILSDFGGIYMGKSWSHGGAQLLTSIKHYSFGHTPSIYKILP